MKRNRDARREFVAIHKVGSLDVRIAAVDHPGKRVEGKIRRSAMPGRLFDRAEMSLGRISKRDAGSGNRRGRCSGGYGQRQEVFVVEHRSIEAEAFEIVGEKSSAANLRSDGLAVGIGESKPEG